MNMSDSPLVRYMQEVLELNEPLSCQFADQMLECIKLFDDKQKDYGSANISRAGYKGVMIRMGDKFCRLESLNGKSDVANEPIDDTLRDIANYAIIALMCRKGLWPGV